MSREEAKKELRRDISSSLGKAIGCRLSRKEIAETIETQLRVHNFRARVQEGV